MKARTDLERSPLDTVKLLLAVVALLAGIGGFYYFSDAPQYFRVPGILAAVVVALILFATTDRGRAVFGVMREARVELRKVVWPTRQETLQTTLVVFIMVLIVAIFLWLLDMFLLWGVNRLMNIGG